MLSKNLLLKKFPDLPNFRISQISKRFFIDGKSDFSDCFELPKVLRSELSSFVFELSQKLPKVCKEVSSSDGTEKALFKTFDGNFFESVLIRQKKRNTVCLSSQIGCPVSCKFCATGRLSFKRNLEAFEILFQVDFWKRKAESAREKIDNVVFMGQGEPFLNFENVKDAVETLNSPFSYNFGARKITVSTVGITPRIYDFAEVLRGQANLAISLHAANQNLRENLIPIAKNYPLDELLKACDEYVKKTNKKIFFEYVLLDGVNSSKKDALGLSLLLKGNRLFHVNLINYNETGIGFKKVSKERLRKFVSILEENNVPVTVRASFGEESFAACGQLGTLSV